MANPVSPWCQQWRCHGNSNCHPDPSFSCPAMCQRDLYSYTSKCQGNKKDTYRKCQEHCPDQPDGIWQAWQALFFISTSKAALRWCIFIILEKIETLSSSKLKQIVLLFTESFGDEVRGQINWSSCTDVYEYMVTGMHTHMVMLQLHVWHTSFSCQCNYAPPMFIYATVLSSGHRKSNRISTPVSFFSFYHMFLWV